MTHFIKSRRLNIVWGNDTRYWKWHNPVPKSKCEIAELTMVWWFDIRGTIDSKELKHNTSYRAYLVFALRDNPQNLDRVYARARFVKDITEGTDDQGVTVYLAKEQGEGEEGVFPRRRSDGWMEVKLGQFYNHLGEDGPIDVRVFETSDYHAKSGIYVVGIDLRPF